MAKRQHTHSEPDRVAAIPYIRQGEEIRFLVVTSKHGWTFPKGSLESGDSGLEGAAKREAREEAGVCGQIDSNRLIQYYFPRCKAADQSVVAFLLEVTEDDLRRKGKDERRKRFWGTAAEIVAKLCEEGNHLYASEVDRVLVAAQRALARRTSEAAPPS
jgi:8-oxo-dGTP pyrophosphatase MutT (NUDIX family)